MKKIVSLEFSTGFIRAAEIEKPHSAKPTLLRYSEIAVDPGVVGDSEIFDVELASNALEELWKLGEFSTKVVNLAISNRRIMVRDYEAPYINLSSIKETLTFEAAELLPSQMENSVLDFYPIEKTDHAGRDNVRGLLIATAAEPLEDIVTSMTLAGLTVEYVDLIPFGLARIARSLIPEEEEYLVVNISDVSSDVVAVKNGTPQMVRVIPNGVTVRKTSSARHRGEITQGEMLNAKETSNAVSDVDAFVGALRATMNFYESKGGNLQKIYLTGEGSLSEEIPPKILAQLGIKARIIDLEAIIGSPKKQEDRNSVVEAALVSVVATALRGMK